MNVHVVLWSTSCCGTLNERPTWIISQMTLWTPPWAWYVRGGPSPHHYSVSSQRSGWSCSNLFFRQGTVFAASGLFPAGEIQLKTLLQGYCLENQSLCWCLCQAWLCLTIAFKPHWNWCGVSEALVVQFAVWEGKLHDKRNFCLVTDWGQSAGIFLPIATTVCGAWRGQGCSGSLYILDEKPPNTGLGPWDGGFPSLLSSGVFHSPNLQNSCQPLLPSFIVKTKVKYLKISFLPTPLCNTV